jgi:hypothetical protein
MAQQRMFTATELVPLLQDRGIALSASHGCSQGTAETGNRMILMGEGGYGA